MIDFMVENRVFLEPSHLIFTSNGKKIVTILGSCVAITMFDKKTNFAGICHAMLPLDLRKEEEKLAENLDFRYVDNSLEKMCEEFFKRNIKKDEITVKLFGGSERIFSNNDSYNIKSVGSQNILVAQKILQLKNFRISASDVGGEEGRKIVFNTENGDVFVKKIANE